jgi:hypothetical protein
LLHLLSPEQSPEFTTGDVFAARFGGIGGFGSGFTGIESSAGDLMGWVEFRAGISVSWFGRPGESISWGLLEYDGLEFTSQK